MNNTRVKCEHHSLNLVSRVMRLRDETHNTSTLCDIEIVVGSTKKQTFKCHRLVLVLSTEYFEVAINQQPGSKVSGNPTVPIIYLPEVDPDIFDKVLDFIYTGEMTLCADIVERVYLTSVLLNLIRLQGLCVDFMLESLNVENCVSYWITAEQSNEAAVIEASKTLFVKEFRRLIASKYLKHLTEDMIGMVLCDDDLAIKSEVDCCEMLVQWMESRKELGKTINPETLLPCIRWSGIHVEYIKSTLLSNVHLTSNERCFAFLSRVLSYHLSGIPFNGLLTFQRPSVGLEKFIFFHRCEHVLNHHIGRSKC